MCNEREIREEKWEKEIIGHREHIRTPYFTYLILLKDLDEMILTTS